MFRAAPTEGGAPQPAESTADARRIARPGEDTQHHQNDSDASELAVNRNDRAHGVVWDDSKVAWTAYKPDEHDIERALPDRIAARIRSLRQERTGSRLFYVIAGELCSSDIAFAESALQCRLPEATAPPTRNNGLQQLRPHFVFGARQ